MIRKRFAVSHVISADEKDLPILCLNSLMITLLLSIKHSSRKLRSLQCNINGFSDVDFSEKSE